MADGTLWNRPRWQSYFAHPRYGGGSLVAEQPAQVLRIAITKTSTLPSGSTTLTACGKKKNPLGLAPMGSQ